MNRYNNLYQKIISVENLKLADVNARKGKSRQIGIKKHDKNKEENINHLHYLLKNKLYKTSPYITFTIFEPKERLIYRLPYSDRIVHHAILNILEPIFVSTFTTDTYSCIKGRGIHSASYKLKKTLFHNVKATTFCLKIDIKKFYPSIKHYILKTLLRRKFKDNDLLWLLDGIIDSSDGVPIGNYISQYLANFYLSYFDHWIKEVQKALYYFRYADDMIFLSGCKKFLHKLLHNIKGYLWDNLKLVLKKTYQIFPVASRGIDFLGYVFFHGYTLIRKGIKKNFARMLKYSRNQPSIESYKGWFKHCNSVNLLNKLLYGTATT